MLQNNTIFSNITAVHCIPEAVNLLVINHVLQDHICIKYFMCAKLNNISGTHTVG